MMVSLEQIETLISADNRLSIYVKPNKKISEILSLQDNVVVVAVAAPPENNKANVELCSFFKKLTGRSCKVVTGGTSKRKIIRFNEA
jgi:uncharacterized protein (TIGR00251 family)